MISKIDFELLETIAGLHEIPAGAYNIRKNSEGAGRQSTENITITTKEDKPGIDIHIKPGTKNESVHIPVIITEAGITETVYNDFYIGEGADVLIVAGCGIHNAGDEKSEHDGIHRFFIGKNAHVKYVEKHYGEGDGGGERVLNPTTDLGTGGKRGLRTGNGADQRCRLYHTRYDGESCPRCKDHCHRTPDDAWAADGAF